MGSDCVWKTALPLICSSGTEQLAFCTFKNKPERKNGKDLPGFPPEAGSLETPESKEHLSLKGGSPGVMGWCQQVQKKSTRCLVPLRELSKPLGSSGALQVSCVVEQ